MKRILVLVICMALALAMVGCKEDSLIGGWYDEGTGLHMMFNEDGTCEFSSIKAEYRTDDGKLIFVIDGEEQFMAYIIEGEELEIIFEGNTDQEVTMHFKRANL